MVGLDISWDGSGCSGYACAGAANSKYTCSPLIFVQLLWRCRLCSYCGHRFCCGCKPRCHMYQVISGSGVQALPVDAPPPPLSRLITYSSHAALREVPSYLQLIQQLQRDGLCINVLAVDGFGALHPRGAGAATQLGVQARLPCVGVGKSLSGACSLREPEVVAMMDERVALQLDISAYCSASAAADSAGSTRCCVSCVAVRKTLASRRPVYVTVSPNPQIPIPLTI